MQVLGFYDNGRIEAFLTAKTLQPEDMSSPVYMPRIAQKLHAFHQVRIEGWEFTDNLFTTIRSWLGIAAQLTFTEPAKQAQFSAVDFNRMSAEIEEVAALCAATASPVVFSHNDLLSGNILELQGSCEAAAAPGPDAALQFIDFEYSDYCARGFDFGNHFNEFAGFDCDYSLYPSASLQKAFFRSYLAGSDEPADEAALDLLVAEANLYSLASHIYWGVWALVQARYSAIDFDYLSYSQLRWQQYYKTKEAFVTKARAVFA
jgi:ethanolamine kinase